MSVSFSPLHSFGKNSEEGKNDEIKGKGGGKGKKKRCGKLPCERKKGWAINCNCKDSNT